MSTNSVYISFPIFETCILVTNYSHYNVKVLTADSKNDLIFQKQVIFDEVVVLLCVSRFSIACSFPPTHYRLMHYHVFKYCYLADHIVVIEFLPTFLFQNNVLFVLKEDIFIAQLFFKDR